MYTKFKKLIYKLLIPGIRIWKKIQWRFYLWNSEKIKLIVGAGGTEYEGWFATDIYTLDITNEKHFKKYFKKKKIDKILAEHVLEHLTDEQLKRTCRNFYKYSSPAVNIRIAVPDGFHTNPEYINKVKPGGTGEGAMDHKNLFNYQTLSKLFEDFKFSAKPVEFWDENGNLHDNFSNDENGYIKRSLINDERNINGIPNYTSLIIDFVKE